MIRTPALACALAAILRAALPGPATAASLTLAPVEITEWKAVQARIETRDRLPARTRLGGTLTELTVSEGDLVEAGQELGRVTDEKLALRLSAIAANRVSLAAQLANAEAEVRRGEDLLARGVTTAQRLDALRTQVDVLRGQIAAVEAEARVVEQQAAEGAILAPAAGRVLDVPLSRGGVVQPGETVAAIGGGGVFLRLAVPERHAADLSEGDPIRIEGPEGAAEGRLARLYPLIENGRVIADVEVPGLSDRFVDARVLVRLPVGARSALMVPAAALVTRGGVDFVTVEGPQGLRAVTVVPGARHETEAGPMVEILTGLAEGDVVATPDE